MALTARVGRRAFRGGLAVLLFGVLLAAAAATLSLVQALRPSVHADCSEALDPVLSRHQVYDEGQCEWERTVALDRSSYATAPIVLRVE